MAKTYFAGKLWTPAESWRTIRTVRADPPARIANVLRGERRTVFQAALEQAQQQFMAASLIGYESRPLNLFYGLSQAGRALAAASAELYPRNADDARRRWPSTSHGLEFAPVGGPEDFWAQEVSIKPTVADTFSRASIAVGSPYLDIGKVELGALAAQLPEFTVEWPEFGWRHSIDAGLNGFSSKDTFTIRLPAFDQTLPDWGLSQLQAGYPALTSLDVDNRAARRVTGFGGERDGIVIPVPSERATPLVMGFHLSDVTFHLGHHYVMPSAGNSTQVLQPLMTWWLVLFSFSMLARYHPKQWTETLTLQTSKSASQVEHLLDLAVSVVPEMVARHLTELPQG